MLEEICKHGANTEDKKVCMKKGEIRKYASKRKVRIEQIAASRELRHNTLTKIQL